jgi:hypothetical protein
MEMAKYTNVYIYSNKILHPSQTKLPNFDLVYYII